MSNNNDWMSVKRRSTLLGGFIVLLAMPLSALAAPDSSSFPRINGVASAGKLSELESQVTTLQLDLEIAQLNAKIAKVKHTTTHPKSKIDQPGQIYPGFTQPAGYPSVQPQIEQEAGQNATVSLSPRILSLSGVHGKYSAMLALPGGGVMNVHSGSDLGDGWTVTRITAQGVTARHHHHIKPLRFADTADRTSASGGYRSMNSQEDMPSILPDEQGDR